MHEVISTLGVVRLDTRQEARKVWEDGTHFEDRSNGGWLALACGITPWAPRICVRQGIRKHDAEMDLAARHALCHRHGASHRTARQA